jgi:mRNA interferase MazF
MGVVIAMAITTQARSQYPLEYELPADLLPRRSWVKIGQIRSISDQRLLKWIGHLAADHVDHIVGGLLEIVNR